MDKKLVQETIHYIGWVDATECGAKGEGLIVTFREEMVTCEDCRGFLEWLN